MEETGRTSGKPDGVRAWVEWRLRRERIAYAVMAVVLAPLAFAVSAAMYALAYLTFTFLFAAGPETPEPDGRIGKVERAETAGGGVTAAGHLMAAATLVGLFAVAKRSTAPPWAPVRVRGDEVNTLVRVSQMTGTGWLVLLQSDRDLPGPLRAAIDVVTFPARLAQLVYVIGKKSFDVAAVDTARVGKLVQLLLKARGRVALFELVEQFPDQDPQELVDDLAAVEGVVFLTNDPPGATLTPMVADEYIAWRAKKREELGLGTPDDEVKWRAT